MTEVNELIGLPQAAKILGIHRQQAWWLWKHRKLQPVMVLGTELRPRPFFNRQYIEQIKNERQAAA